VGYLALCAVVVGVNLLPAFGPPTWTILVYARLRWHYDPVALVALGVLSSTIGRAALAVACRRLAPHVSARYRANLSALRDRLVARRRGAVALAGLFLVSPLPSAQLFCAAGLLELRLAPLLGAFALGRLVTYSLYVATATVVSAHFNNVLANVWGQPWWIAVEVALLAGLVVVPLVPWGRLRAPFAPTAPPSAEVPGDDRPER